MNIKDIIRAEKIDVEPGSWKSGHISKNALSLAAGVYKFHVQGDLL